MLLELFLFTGPMKPLARHHLTNTGSRNCQFKRRQTQIHPWAFPVSEQELVLTRQVLARLSGQQSGERNSTIEYDKRQDVLYTHERIYQECL